MRQADCFFERVSNFGAGMALMFIALGLIVIGVNIVPVLGIFIAVPIFLVAAYFFTAPANPECRIN